MCAKQLFFGIELEFEFRVAIEGRFNAMVNRNIYKGQDNWLYGFDEPSGTTTFNVNGLRFDKLMTRLDIFAQLKCFGVSLPPRHL